MMSRKICSITWDGLRSGPKFSGKDPELKKMTTEFLSKHKDMGDDPVKFGEEMRAFAEDRGYEVEDNVYCDTQISEAMSSSEEKKFLEALKAGKVEFSYKKVDGSTREAVGTLKPELMKKAEATDKKIADGKKKHFVPPTILVYWDLEAAGFRSFRKENFIKFKAVKEDKEEDKKKKEEKKED